MECFWWINWTLNINWQRILVMYKSFISSSKNYIHKRWIIRQILVFEAMSVLSLRTIENPNKSRFQGNLSKCHITLHMKVWIYDEQVVVRHLFRWQMGRRYSCPSSHEDQWLSTSKQPTDSVACSFGGDMAANHCHFHPPFSCQALSAPSIRYKCWLSCEGGCILKRHQYSSSPGSINRTSLCPLITMVKDDERRFRTCRKYGRPQTTEGSTVMNALH